MMYQSLLTLWPSEYAYRNQLSPKIWLPTKSSVMPTSSHLEVQKTEVQKTLKINERFITNFFWEEEYIFKCGLGEGGDQVCTDSNRVM